MSSRWPPGAGDGKLSPIAPIAVGVSVPPRRDTLERDREALGVAGAEAVSLSAMAWKLCSPSSRCALLWFTAGALSSVAAWDVFTTFAAEDTTFLIKCGASKQWNTITKQALPSAKTAAMPACNNCRPLNGLSFVGMALHWREGAPALRAALATAPAHCSESQINCAAEPAVAASGTYELPSEASMAHRAAKGRAPPAPSCGQYPLCRRAVNNSAALQQREPAVTFSWMRCSPLSPIRHLSVPWPAPVATNATSRAGPRP